VGPIAADDESNSSERFLYSLKNTGNGYATTVFVRLDSLKNLLNTRTSCIAVVCDNYLQHSVTWHTSCFLVTTVQSTHVVSEKAMTNGTIANEVVSSLDLNLVIKDRNILGYLAQFHDEETQIEKAIEALKVGVVAILHTAVR
jgi:hypothetical protein